MANDGPFFSGSIGNNKKKKGDEFRIQMKKGAYLITVREISEINLILPVGVGGVEANNDTSPQSV
jgi:hypothetical protein